MIPKPAFLARFNRLFVNCTLPSQVWKGSGNPPTGFVAMDVFVDEFYQLFKDKEEQQLVETIDEWIRTSEDRFFPYPRELRRLWATMFGGLTQAARERQEREEIDRQNRAQEERYAKIKAEVEGWPRAMQIAHKNAAQALYVENVPAFIRDSEAELQVFVNIGKKIYFIKAYEEMTNGTDGSL